MLKVPLTPNFFFSRLKYSFVADHIDEKIIVVRFFLVCLRIFKVRKICAILVQRRVLRRLGRIWSMTSTGEAISLVLETLSERQREYYSTMPDRCVAANCSNVADPAKRIFVHNIPFFGDSRPEAIKRRKKWVDFIQAKRAKWEPNNKAPCSVFSAI